MNPTPNTKALIATMNVDIARLMVTRKAIEDEHEAGLHTELAKLGGGPGPQAGCHLCTVLSRGKRYSDTTTTQTTHETLERLDHKAEDFLGDAEWDADDDL